MLEGIAADIERDGQRVVFRRPLPNGETMETGVGFLPWGSFPWDGQVTFQDATVRAVVRGYRPDELVGDLTQGVRLMQLHPAELEAQGWPVPPKRGDSGMIDGRTFTVEECEVRRLGDQVAKYLVTVKAN